MLIAAQEPCQDKHGVYARALQALIAFQSQTDLVFKI